MADGAVGELDRLVTAVTNTPSYGAVCRELVAAAGARELAKGRSLKEAIKATKNKLHQMAGAFVQSAPHYDQWLVELASAQQSTNPDALRAACKRIMAWHSSTRERLPILESFYPQALASCSPIHSVLDLACGLNPLAIPWMPLAAGARYYACDVFTDMMSFVDRALPVLDVSGRAWACNLVAGAPAETVDVALLLKAIPCFEQLEKGSALRLLDAVNARSVLVSFPIASLGGRDKGMLANYEAGFAELMGQRSWTAQRFEFASELAFLVTK